jgi:AcrR family transcriptional regulator
VTKGRPKLSNEELESRKSALITIAKRLFLEEGYQAVSMRKIASAAGISPMMLYKSFDNKRDILRYIWTDIFVEVREHCSVAADSAKSDREKLHRFCSAFLQYWLANPEHYRVVYLESDQLESSGDTYFADDEIVTSLFGQLATLVAALSSEETDVELKANLLTLQLQGIAHGLIVLSEISWGDPKQLLDNCLAMFESSL